MWCYLLKNYIRWRLLVEATLQINSQNNVNNSKHIANVSQHNVNNSQRNTQFISQRTQLFISQRTQFITQPTNLLKLHQNYELLLELHQYGF